MDYVQISILVSLLIIIIIFIIVNPKIVMFIYILSLMAFNDLIGGLPSTIININGHLFYASDFFIILFAAGCLRSVLESKTVTDKFTRLLLIIMIYLSVIGITGLIIGFSKGLPYNAVIGDFRRYFYYPWAIFVPPLIIHNKTDCAELIRKASLLAAPIICIFALYRIIEWQSYSSQVHSVANFDFRAMGYHDYLVLIFVICISIGRILQYKQHRNLLEKFYLILLPCFVIISNYRIAWILLVLCPLTMLLLLRSRGFRLKPIKWIVIASFFCVILPLVAGIFIGSKSSRDLGKRFSDHVVNFSFGNQESWRAGLWSTAIGKWKESPFLGKGFGVKYDFWAMTPNGEWYIANPADLHNSYLELLLKSGIIGLVFFLSLYGILIKRCLKIFYEGSDSRMYISAAGIAFIFAVLLQTATQPLLSIPNDTVLIYLIIGSIVVLPATSANSKICTVES